MKIDVGQPIKTKNLIMKSILAILLVFSSFSLFAQTVGDDLGTVSCEFDIHSGSNELDIRKKVLVRRATTEGVSSNYENQSYAYGYAYSEWHLEFISNTPIGSRKKASEEDYLKRGKYCIQLLNLNGDVLMKTYLIKDDLRSWEGAIDDKPIYTYSLDLINIPLVIIDDVDALNIIQID